MENQILAESYTAKAGGCRNLFYILVAIALFCFIALIACCNVDLSKEEKQEKSVKIAVKNYLEKNFKSYESGLFFNFAINNKNIFFISHCFNYKDSLRLVNSSIIEFELDSNFVVKNTKNLSYERN